MWTIPLGMLDVHIHIPINYIAKWQPTPVFLPGESLGQGSLVGCRLWGRTEHSIAYYAEKGKKV